MIGASTVGAPNGPCGQQSCWQSSHLQHENTKIDHGASSRAGSRLATSPDILSPSQVTHSEHFGSDKPCLAYSSHRNSYTTRGSKLQARCI